MPSIHGVVRGSWIGSGSIDTRSLANLTPIDSLIGCA
jgi:hypothetical protein